VAKISNKSTSSLDAYVEPGPKDYQIKQQILSAALQNSSTVNHEEQSKRPDSPLKNFIPLSSLSSAQQAFYTRGKNAPPASTAPSTNTSFCPSTTKQLERGIIVTPELVPKQPPSKQAPKLDDSAYSDLWDDATWGENDTFSDDDALLATSTQEEHGFVFELLAFINLFFSLYFSEPRANMDPNPTQSPSTLQVSTPQPS
jgi:hypothetical protein